MQITITARHCEISDELRARAEAVLDRLASVATRPVEATLVFDLGPVSATAEIRLKAARGEVLVAEGDGKDHRSALDRAEERLRRQLDRAESARREHGAKDVA